MHVCTPKIVTRDQRCFFPLWLTVSSGLFDCSDRNVPRNGLTALRLEKGDAGVDPVGCTINPGGGRIQDVCNQLAVNLVLLREGATLGCLSGRTPVDSQARGFPGARQLIFRSLSCR